jgi:phenylalanyl-tRNA synthetase alpha chain
MAEVLQQLILDTLDSSSSIEDTRSLTIPGESGPAISQDAQITILGALNSLLSREVSPSLLLSQLYSGIA